ncbi:cytochrome P460 family protein [Spirochaeta thermophila]|nr:cytochrome P460 family protein [Spirochaeta thermophila]
MQRRERSLMGVVVVLLVLPVIAGCEKERASYRVPEGYRAWKRTTTVELDYPIPGHGTAYRRIYVSPEGETPQRGADGSYVYPEGTMVVKEVYRQRPTDPEQTPDMFTVMIKAPEDPRSRGGWIWLVQSGDEVMIVSDSFCESCHENANEPHPYGDGNPRGVFRDYLFFPYPPPRGNGEAAQ